MKQTIRKVAFAFALCASLVTAFIVHAKSYIAVTGNYVDGSTNVVVVAGTNIVVSSVLNGATNYFNMPNAASPSTNAWPAIIFPNTLNVDAWHYAGIQVVTSTNLGDDVILRFAASCDASHWTSNTFVFKVPKSASIGNVITNLESYGFPYYAFQSIENVSASNVTGLAVIITPKPGL